jgi:hypothetical protein
LPGETLGVIYFLPRLTSHESRIIIGHPSLGSFAKQEKLLVVSYMFLRDPALSHNLVVD